MDIDVYASGSSGNCYRISDGTTALLIECGIPCRQILRHIGFDLSGIAGVLVSHEHTDHARAAKELALLGADIYSSRGTFKSLSLCGRRFREVKASQKFSIGSFEIYPFEVQHDAAEPLGFVITSSVTKERLMFFTDTYYVKYVFKNINIIMGEVNYSLDTLSEETDPARRKRLFESHMSLEHFLEFLRASDLSRVSKIYLLHLSDDNSDAEMFRREVMKVSGAEVIIC
mgnify:CR=1 FL=1